MIIITTTYIQNVLWSSYYVPDTASALKLQWKRETRTLPIKKFIFLREEWQRIHKKTNKRTRDWCFKNSTGKYDRGDWTGGCMIRKGLLDNMTFELIPDRRGANSSSGNEESKGPVVGTNLPYLGKQRRGMCLLESSKERRRRQRRKRGRGQSMQGLVGHNKKSGIHVLEWICSK